MTNDFDRELAKSIGFAASKIGRIDRALIFSCYQEVSTLLSSVESNQVSEKWIDFLTGRLDGLKIAGRNSDQISKMVFERIAKT